MDISIDKAKMVRVARMSIPSGSLTIQIEGERDNVSISLYGLPEEDRLRLCAVLGDATSKVRTENDLRPMSEWLIENAVHKAMHVDKDDGRVIEDD